ncbi:MAG TPA: 4Fe-4S dicluster domain-containing protein [Gammaproteobacteria bacterium]|nr:4Fe-4S dicluster domain-containing protein [Gammaproteobacteria bacterium]
MKRRNFLQKITFGAGILGFSSLPFGLSRLLYPEANASLQNYSILPGALPDPEAFIEACIGCGLCGEVCPPKCILFHKNDGGPESNKPYIHPAVKSCILCGYCMEVCPTEALTVTPIREVDMGIAQIDRAACYPWVDKGVCGACVSVCPLGEKAIDFDFGNFYRPVVKEGCVGCGQCVEVCPEPSLPIRIVQNTDSTVARHGVGLNQQYKWQTEDRLKY